MLDADQVAEVQAVVANKVTALMSASAYNNFSEQQLENKRVALTEKYFDMEYERVDKALEGSTAAPPPPHPLQRTLHEQTEALRQIRPLAPLSLTQLADGLPLQHQRDFVASVGRTLSVDDKLPAKQGLSSFQEQVKHAINGLSTAFNVGDLSHAHILQLAPYFLGEMAWQAVKLQGLLADWVDLIARVNRSFGLTPAQIEDAFFSMTLAQGESADDFLLRVESKKLRYNIDPKLCYRCFLSSLPVDYKRNLDCISEIVRVLNPQNHGILDWDALIQHARQRTSGIKLVAEPDRHVQGFGPQGTAPPLPGVAFQATTKLRDRCVSRGRPSLYGQYNNQERGSQKSDLCESLGRLVASSHTLKDCYINPRSLNFKPGLHRLRLAELATQGKQVPPLMLLNNQPQNKPIPWPLPPPPRPAVDGGALQAFGSDLASMLDEEGANFDRCLEEAASHNLGIDIKGSSPDECLMFKEANLGSSADFSAHGKATEAARTQLLKEHLKALSAFNEADFIAAMDDEREDDADPTFEQGDDAASEQGSEGTNDGNSEAYMSVDDMPLAQRAGDDQMRKLIQEMQDKQAARILAAVQRKTTPKRTFEPLTPRPQAVSAYAGKFRVSLPLSEVLYIKPNLRGYVNNLVADPAYKQQTPLRVVKGTKIVEVTKEQLAFERQTLADSELNNVAGVVRKFKDLAASKRSRGSKRTNRAQLLQEHADRIAQLLQGMTVDKDSKGGESEGTGDPIFHSKQPSTHQGPTISAPQHPPQVLLWSTCATNLSGLVPPSDAHYMESVKVNGCLIEAIVDSRGARTMMDTVVVERLGLPLEQATKRKNFGSFQGTGGKNISYVGRVTGPIKLTLADGVGYNLLEVKVMTHSEPLFLLGTDALVDNLAQPWQFGWVGIHSIDRKGQWVFSNQKGEVREIDLAYWPLPLDPTGKRYRSVGQPTQGKHVRFADDTPPPLTASQRAVGTMHRALSAVNRAKGKQLPTDPTSDPRTTAVRRFLALVKDQGQRL